MEKENENENNELLLTEEVWEASMMNIASKPGTGMLMTIFPEAKLGQSLVGAAEQVTFVGCGGPMCPAPWLEVDKYEFRDKQSVREFNISAMCQYCQDTSVCASAEDAALVSTSRNNQVHARTDIQVGRGDGQVGVTNA